MLPKKRKEKVDYDLAILMPSRGLIYAQTMQALENQLYDLYKQKKFRYKFFFTPGNLKLPDCRNDIVKQLEESSISFDYALWCDDDMVPPPKALVTMVEALQESPDDVAGVVAQSYSSTLGSPPPPGVKMVPCMQAFASPSQYPKGWWFAKQGGLAFSLWRRETFYLIKKRPIFTWPKGEDYEFMRLVSKIPRWVRALRDITIGHCFTESYKIKGRQRDAGEYNGCHVIKRYEEFEKDAIQLVEPGPGVGEKEGSQDSPEVG